MQKLLTFFQQNISIYAIFNEQSFFKDTLTKDIVSFEQLSPGFCIKLCALFTLNSQTP